MEGSSTYYFLTAEGIFNLRKEYERLKNVERPKVIQRIKQAREMGNLEDNQEYDLAREAQNILEGRILEILEILEHARTISDSDLAAPEYLGRISLGKTVTVEVQGKQQTFTLVGSIESDPGNGKLSHESPVGSKLMGLKSGDVVTIELPHATFDYKIIQVHN